jgi:hypothetical protein
MAIFAAMFFSSDDTQYGTIITGVVALTTGYMGIQVANNGIKGKFWNNDLYEKENPDAIRSAASKIKEQGDNLQ